MSEIIRYELSEDGKGLLAYCIDGQFYYVPFDLCNELEEWIYKVLAELKRLKGVTGQSNILL